MDSLFKMAASPHLTMPKIPEILSLSENYSNIVVNKIKQMYAGLKKDQDLLVHCETAGGETMRVLNLQFTGGAVILVYGIDADENPMAFISTAFALQLTCKVVTVAPEAKRAPIGFDFPKGEEETGKGKESAHDK